MRYVACRNWLHTDRHMDTIRVHNHPPPYGGIIVENRASWMSSSRSTLKNRVALHKVCPPLSITLKPTLTFMVNKMRVQMSRFQASALSTPFLNPFSPTFFSDCCEMSLPKCSAPSGITHPVYFLTFGHSGAHFWAPECPNAKKLKRLG